MPVVTVTVERVMERQVRLGYQQFKRKFDVSTKEHRTLFQTWDAWTASLCDRARMTGRRLVLSTRDTKWGPEIVKVEFAPEEQTV